MLELVCRTADSVPTWNTLLGLTLFGAFCSVIFIVGVIADMRKG